MIADISQASAALLAAATGLLVAILGAVWRMGTMLGRLTRAIDDHGARLERLESHEDNHDNWHRVHGDR